MGWNWFAAAIIAIGGVFNLFDGLISLTNARYWADVQSAHNVTLPVTNDLKTWGWVAIGLAVLMLATAFGVLAGSMWARVVGVVLVGLDMVYQIGFLGAFPFWALVILALDTLVIYALVVHVRRSALG